MASAADSFSQTYLLWRVRLLDGLAVCDNAGKNITHFRSRKVRALLAYLAMHLGQACSRETLCAALWPEEPSERVAANRLRVALSSLRHQLEPSGVPFGAVLDVSETGCIRLSAQTVWCDLTAFDQAWKNGRRGEAACLLRGSLLPGICEEWLADEQARIELLREELREEALRSLLPFPTSFPTNPPIKPLMRPPTRLPLPPHLLPPLRQHAICLYI